MGKAWSLTARLSLAVLVAGTLATGCHFGGGSGEDAATVVVALPADNPGDIEVRQALANEFMKQNPKIPVKVQVIPTNGYNEKIFTEVAAGTPPDIFNSGDVIIPTIVSKNYAYDLNKFVRRDHYDLSKFYPEVIDGLTFQDKLVGLTDNWDTQVMYYNRDLFDQAGLSYPDASWTWDDFAAAARRLTSGEGPKKVYGAVLGTWFAPLLDQIWSRGGDMFNQDGTQCVMDSPQAVQAVQSVADLIKEGVAPTPQQLEGQSPTQLMLSGRGAMVLDAGRWAAFDLEQGRVDWAVAPVPKGPEGRANFFHLSMYAITRTSDSPENAWKFLKFMVSKKAIEESVKNMQGIPARPTLTKSPAFRNDPLVKQHDTLQPFLESLPTAHKAPYVANFEQYDDTIGSGLDRVWTGDETAAEALPKVCEAVDKQLSQADNGI